MRWRPLLCGAYGPGQLGASACQVEWCPASIAYDGVGVDCVQNATSAIRRLPLWGLYPNWLLELARKSLHRNPLRKRLHQWLSWGAGVRDIEFVHYVLMHRAPVAPQHAWPAAVPIQPNHSSALTTVLELVFSSSLWMRLILACCSNLKKSA